MRIRSSLRGFAAAFVLGAGLLVAPLLPAIAEDARGAVQATIARQMDAFERDDAAAAYAFASSGIKALYPDPQSFLAMVRDHYGPVYRPKRVAFGELTPTDVGVRQIVTIVDAEGQAWTALYTLARDEAGQWRITGCVLLKAPETNA